MNVGIHQIVLYQALHQFYTFIVIQKLLLHDVRQSCWKIDDHRFFILVNTKPQTESTQPVQPEIRTTQS